MAFPRTTWASDHPPRRRGSALSVTVPTPVPCASVASARLRGDRSKAQPNLSDASEGASGGVDGQDLPDLGGLVVAVAVEQGLQVEAVGLGAVARDLLLELALGGPLDVVLVQGLQEVNAHGRLRASELLRVMDRASLPPPASILLL